MLLDSCATLFLVNPPISYAVPHIENNLSSTIR